MHTALVLVLIFQFLLFNHIIKRNYYTYSGFSSGLIPNLG